MAKFRLIILLVVIGSPSITCGQQAPKIESVKIGSQEWMIRNLDVSKFRNGDLVPEAKTRAEWEEANYDKKPAWCYNSNDPANGSIYGKLYNWFAVSDPRGLAPKGWHIPSDSEWTTLTNYLGGKDKAGLSLKSTSGWDEAEPDNSDQSQKMKDGNGNNHSGFAGLPGGAAGGESGGVGESGTWWSSSTNNRANMTDASWVIGLINSDGKVYRSSSNIGSGYSVRCLKD